MELPILENLKDGEKFDFATLAENTEQTDLFWDWWWETNEGREGIFRPEIIADDDPVLIATNEKSSVECWSYFDLFDKTLRNLVRCGAIPCDHGGPRSSFRSDVQRIIFKSSTKLPSRPQLVFAGGGYGSGKTYTLNYLAEAGALPVEMSHLVGVDVFKSLIPEYHLIKAVADGRASLTVQKECNTLANELFERLVEAGNSFAWDSSMSNKDESLARVQMAKDQGYELTLVAVLTPFQQAISQAMKRAKETRRFPHPDKLPESHQRFRQNFNDYVPLFDEVTVIANSRDRCNVPMVIAEKSGEANGLEVLDQPLLDSLLRI